LRRFLRGELGQTIRWLLVVHFVCIAWVFFRCPDAGSAVEYLATIVRRVGDGAPLTASPLVFVLMAAGFMTPLLTPSAYAAADGSFRRIPVAAKVAFSTATIWAVIMLAPSGVAPFIYFQF
jgi:hypothetical protein